MTYVRGTQFTVTTSLSDATLIKTDSYVTTNLVIDSYYDTLNQLVLSLFNKADLTVVAQKKLSITGLTFTNIKVTAKVDETEFYLAFTSNKMSKIKSYVYLL